MKKTVGKGAEPGCLMLSAAEGCSCPLWEQNCPRVSFYLCLVQRNRAGQESLEWEKGKTPVLLVWVYVVCHPGLVGQQGAPPGVTPLLFPSRRPPPSRWSSTEEIRFSHFSPLWSKGIVFWGTHLHLFYCWLTESTDCPYSLSPHLTS